MTNSKRQANERANSITATHLNLLPKVQIYTASQLKRYIPIHYPTLKGNILSIFRCLLPELEQQFNVRFCPDTRLPKMLHSTQEQKKCQMKYSQTIFTWVEDVDKNTSNQHLRDCLQIAVGLCDFLYSLCMGNQDNETDSNTQKDKKESFSNTSAIKSVNSRSNNNINKKGLLGKRHFHPQQQGCLSKIERISIVGREPQQYKSILFGQDVQPKQLIESYKPTFAYNFWKEVSEDRYYFAVAINSCPVQSAYLIMQSFRQWNSERLNLKHHMASHKTLQHIFLISRSCILGSKEQDFNINKLHLKKINEQVKSIDLSGIQLQELCNSRHLGKSLLQPKNSVLVIYKCRITSRNSIEESQSQMFLTICYLWSHILLASQLKAPLSHAFSLDLDESCNQIVITFSLNYTQTHQSSKIQSTSVLAMLNTASQFQNIRFQQDSLSSESIVDEIFRNSISILKKYDRNKLVKDFSTRRLQSSIISGSSRLLMVPSPFKPKIEESGLQRTPIKGSTQSARKIATSNNSQLQKSFYPHQISSSTNRLNKSMIARREDLNTSTLSAKPSVLRLENAYYELLMKIQKQVNYQQHLIETESSSKKNIKHTSGNSLDTHCGISPENLRVAMIQNMRHIQKSYRLTDQLNRQQHKLLKSIGAMCLRISPEDVTILINRHFNTNSNIQSEETPESIAGFEDKGLFSENLDAILEVFLQPQQWQLAIEVGKKLGEDHLSQLFKTYTNIVDSSRNFKSNQNTFGNYDQFRFSIISQYLKRVVQRYSARQINSISYQRVLANLDHIPTGEIITLLTTDNISDERKGKSQSKSDFRGLYCSFLAKLSPTLFITNQSAQQNLYPIARILHYYYQQLSNSQHNQELLYSFLLEVAFEVTFFSHQTSKFAMLNHDAYLFSDRSNKIDGIKSYSESTQLMKARKVTNLLREHGFGGLGYESRNYFLPLLTTLSKEHAKKVQNPLYYVVCIKKPINLRKFFQLLTRSHFTQNLILVVQFYRRNPKLRKLLEAQGSHQQEQKLRHAIGHCYYRADIEAFSLQQNVSHGQSELYNQTQSADRFLAEGTANSQSGIFKQLLARNPALKIAGLPLSRILDPRTNPDKWNALRKFNDIQQPKDTSPHKVFDLNTAFDKTFPEKTVQAYELIKTVLNLRQKYIKYHLLDEQQRSYFREVVAEIIQKRQHIENYLQITKRLNNYRKQVRKDENLSGIAQTL